MTVVYNPKTAGLFTNGCAELGTNTNFTSYTLYQEDSLSGKYCFGMITNTKRATINSNDYIPVDTSKTYQIAVSVRTLQRSGWNNRPGSGHLGFTCYDKNKVYIDLRQCGGKGNTVLTRDLNPGDTNVYIASTSGWSTYFSPTYGGPPDTISYGSIFRHIILYPATHPEYSTPYQLSRIGYGDFDLRYKSMTQVGPSEWALKLSNADDSDAVMPNIGYSTPAGTPVSNGQAGSSHCYALGAPDYPDTWTTYVSAAFTGEAVTGTVPFRWATKYIRFLNLPNYNYRGDTTGTSAFYLLDNIMFVECKNGKAYDKSFFSRTDIS